MLAPGGLLDGPGIEAASAELAVSAGERERPAPDSPGAPGPGGGIAGTRYGRYLVIFGACPGRARRGHGSARARTCRGSRRGRIPPFAAPLALGSLAGDVNVATRPNRGRPGTAACTVRGAQVLNVCQLYEQGPLALALFVDAGSCAAVLRDMQALAASFRRALCRGRGQGRNGCGQAARACARLTFPVGLDRDGILVGLYAWPPARSSGSCTRVASFRARRCSAPLAPRRCAPASHASRRPRARGWSPSK